MELKLLGDPDAGAIHISYLDWPTVPEWFLEDGQLDKVKVPFYPDHWTWPLVGIANGEGVYVKRGVGEVDICYPCYQVASLLAGWP